jgi:hypothetical protein
VAEGQEAGQAHPTLRWHCISCENQGVCEAERSVGKRIVIATFGSFGDVNPCVGLALGLKQRGHSPVIATAEFYRSYVQRRRD